LIYEICDFFQPSGGWTIAPSSPDLYEIARKRRGGRTPRLILMMFGSHIFSPRKYLAARGRPLRSRAPPWDGVSIGHAGSHSKSARTAPKQVFLQARACSRTLLSSWGPVFSTAGLLGAPAAGPSLLGTTGDRRAPPDPTVPASSVVRIPAGRYRSYYGQNPWVWSTVPRTAALRVHFFLCRLIVLFAACSQPAEMLACISTALALVELAGCIGSPCYSNNALVQVLEVTDLHF